MKTGSMQYAVLVGGFNIKGGVYGIVIKNNPSVQKADFVRVTFHIEFDSVVQAVDV